MCLWPLVIFAFCLILIQKSTRNTNSFMAKLKASDLMALRMKILTSYHKLYPKVIANSFNANLID